MAPRPTASVADASCVITNSRRLSARSATTPPHGPATSMGANCAATTSPRWKPLPVSSSTSQASATDCSHVPDRDTTWPQK